MRLMTFGALAVAVLLLVQEASGQTRVDEAARMMSKNIAKQSLQSLMLGDSQSALDLALQAFPPQPTEQEMAALPDAVFALEIAAGSRIARIAEETRGLYSVDSTGTRAFVGFFDPRAGAEGAVPAIHDPRDGTLIRRLVEVKAATAPEHSPVFSPDGRLLAYPNMPGNSVHLFNAQDGSWAGEMSASGMLERDAIATRPLGFSSDGAFYAVGYLGGGGGILVWNVSTRSLVRHLVSNSGPGRTSWPLGWDHEDGFAVQNFVTDRASGRRSGVVLERWAMDGQRRTVADLAGVIDAPSSRSFTFPGVPMVLMTDEARLAAIDLETGSVRFTTEVLHPEVALVRGGSAFAIRPFDLGSLDEFQVIDRRGARLPPEGRDLIPLVQAAVSRTGKLVAVARNATRHTYGGQDLPHGSALYGAVLQRLSGDRRVVIDQNGAGAQTDAARVAQLMSQNFATEAITALRHGDWRGAIGLALRGLPDGPTEEDMATYAAAAFALELAAGARVPRIPQDREARFSVNSSGTRAFISHWEDSSRLDTGAFPQSIIDPRDGRVIRQLEPQIDVYGISSPGISASFSPDGTLLAVPSNRTSSVHVFAAGDGAYLGEMRPGGTAAGRKGVGYEVGFSVDGRLYARGYGVPGAAGIHVWDVATRQLLYHLPMSPDRNARQWPLGWDHQANLFVQTVIRDPSALGQSRIVIERWSLSGSVSPFIATTGRPFDAEFTAFAYPATGLLFLSTEGGVTAVDMGNGQVRFVRQLAAPFVAMARGGRAVVLKPRQLVSPDQFVVLDLAGNELTIRGRDAVAFMHALFSLRGNRIDESRGPLATTYLGHGTAEGLELYHALWAQLGAEERARINEERVPRQ
ncbi:hypothetical protein [Rhodobacter sp. NSM]|uniref:hypothetical protein n=1 Tax=Rhodobacter sp. NSM TaxID=3457501 RepID=UPI003FD5B251